MVQLTQYTGTVADMIPTAIPTIHLPAISIPSVTLPPCRAPPNMARRPPRNMAALLPNASDMYDTITEPIIAPPV